MFYYGVILVRCPHERWQRKCIRITLYIPHYFSKLLEHLQIRRKMQISIYILFHIIIIAIITVSHYICIAHYLL